MMARMNKGRQWGASIHLYVEMSPFQDVSLDKSKLKRSKVEACASLIGVMRYAK